MRKYAEWRSLAAVLFVVVTAVLTQYQSPANAADGQRPAGLPAGSSGVSAVEGVDPGSAPLTVAPGTHRCHNWGVVVQGYRAGECVAIDLFTNSQGSPAIRAQGQSFCQRDSDAAIVQCAAIHQEVYLYNSTTGVSHPAGFFHCGARNGYPPCPAGRFQNLSPGAYRYCNHTYWALIKTSVALPVSGQWMSYENWNSASFVPRSNCVV